LDVPVGPPVFSDVAGSTHERSIYAVASRRIAAGYADGTYRPGQPVTRGQMATFLSRALDLPPGPPVFTDVRGTTHDLAIYSVANEQIAGGYADGTYRPGQPVTRGQMATFLARALDVPVGSPAFSDVAGSTHARSIYAIAGRGIAGGYPDGTYRPGQPVTRGQMATFLARALGLDH
jgi:hypothetical protein